MYSHLSLLAVYLTFKDKSINKFIHCKCQVKSLVHDGERLFSQAQNGARKRGIATLLSGFFLWLYNPIIESSVLKVHHILVMISSCSRTNNS